MATVLNVSELQKRSWRIGRFVNKLAHGGIFEYKDELFPANRLIHYKGKEHIATYNPADGKDMLLANDALKNATNADKFYVKHVHTGDLAPIWHLRKTSEFGGKGSGCGLVKEHLALQTLQKEIHRAMRENVGPISIKLDGITVRNIVGVESTNKLPKSDFTLINHKGEHVAWISHKHGNRPIDFPRYGGVSESREPILFEHDEVQKFIRDLKKKAPNGLTSCMSFYRPIKCESLQMLSVYGNQYTTGKLGEQNVTAVVQGDIELVKRGKVFDLKSHMVHSNGTPLEGAYAPALWAVYRSDRSNAGIKNAALLIAAIEGRSTSSAVRI